MSEKKFNVLECPICLSTFKDTTTFLCGHSCCIEEAKQLSECPMCGITIPEPDKLVVNFMMRDIVMTFSRTTLLK